jgi:hypothetical protein
MHTALAPMTLHVIAGTIWCHVTALETALLVVPVME